ncbi:hypothetical protein H0A61_02159 [Koleobacter methoxysyntrophicus]|uniref:Uncharacterized protein n=1 Tax=Koleobacter methoxysyntrophicus TaxID=2751313 RepID=A0A8A0RQE5_9FIRM|nr:hypothetical protein [Koleobacter methoxysyntrophicus]QSQ09778.1 hypothetical protein H0A61_02159 [Koleobacter methoxysyntrophicus]
MQIFNEKYNMILTHDLDSYLACCLLQQYFGWKVQKFYTFNFMYENYLDYDKEKEDLGVDLTLRQGKCIHNHVERFTPNGEYNKESISPNKHVTMQNYHEKSSFSTTLFLWAKLSLPLPDDDLGKAILLAIDSCHWGYYDRYRLENYLEEYGLIELIDLLKKHTKEDFDILQKKLGLKRDIKLIDRVKYYEFKELNIKQILDHLGLQKLELPLVLKKIQYFEEKETLGDSWFLGNYLKKQDVYSYSIVNYNRVKWSRPTGNG